MALATSLRTALRAAAQGQRRQQRAARNIYTRVDAAAAAHSDATASASAAVAASASASLAAAAAAAAPSCQTLEEARSLIEQVYGRAMWERIQQRSPAATSASVAAAAPSLLHVTSLFHPRGAAADASHASDLYTLQVTGSHSPRHALDRFALCLARSVASEVIYSGKVLREEPHLRCEVDAPFAGGLGALRSIAAAPSSSASGSQPALSILTRASSLSDVVGGLDFAHPIWDAHCGATQPITVYHARPSFGESIRSALKRTASSAATATESEDEIAVELASLVRAVHEEDALTSASSSTVVRQRQPSHLQLRHPHKLIRFRCTHNASALAVVQQMQSQAARRLAVAAQVDSRVGSHPFLSQLSIEAGPQVTRSLYGDLLRSPASSSAVLLRPPVQTLLLSVYRGAIPPEHYRRFLVYPSSHALAASNAAAVDSAAAAAGAAGSSAASAAVESSAPPAPTLTLPFLHRFYRQMSEYHCPRDKDWSFLWFERKD